ncbi:hypothetical protein QUC31_002005 [Theobroma cacao]
MKAIFLIVCILFASSLFIPTSTMARQLIEKRIPNKRPAVPIQCGRNAPSKNCIPGNRPKKPIVCGDPYNRYCHPPGP